MGKILTNCRGFPKIYWKQNNTPFADKKKYDAMWRRPLTIIYPHRRRTWKGGGVVSGSGGRREQSHPHRGSTESKPCHVVTHAPAQNTPASPTQNPPHTPAYSSNSSNENSDSHKTSHSSLPPRTKPVHLPNAPQNPLSHQSATLCTHPSPTQLPPSPSVPHSPTASIWFPQRNLFINKEWVKSLLRLKQN